MELNGWSSPQMLRRYGASARSARARRTYDRIMAGNLDGGCDPVFWHLGDPVCAVEADRFWASQQVADVSALPVGVFLCSSLACSPDYFICGPSFWLPDSRLL